MQVNLVEHPPLFPGRTMQGNPAVPVLVRAKDVEQTTPRGSVGSKGVGLGMPGKGEAAVPVPRLCAAVRAAEVPFPEERVTGRVQRGLPHPQLL